MTESTGPVLATDQGVQVPFEVRMFTLQELLSMRTATTNEQSPLNAKRNEGLAQDLATNRQLEPFKVIEMDGILYLAGGRNRAHCQALMLHRPLAMQFACLYYVFDTPAQVNRVILSDNNTRKTSKSENIILAAAGSTGKTVGSDDLSDNYQIALDDGELKTVKEWFIAETLARLLVLMPDSELTGTTITQILTSLWTAVFTDKKAKAKMVLFYRSPVNIYAFQQLVLDTLPGAINGCMKKYPHVRSWAREGKGHLVDAVVLAIKASLQNEFTFPLGPVIAPATQSKAKSKTKPAMVITGVVNSTAVDEVEGQMPLPLIPEVVALA